MAERRSARPAAALVVALTVAAYATAFGAAFQFDDQHTVVANAATHGWAAWWASLPGIRALTKASYVASHALSPAPWSYVLGGVILHVAAALLALFLVRRWLADLAPGVARAGHAAAVAALAFALHPAQTEAVTYVSGRSVVLAGALVLASLAAHERWRDTKAWRWRLASLAAFALALAARETAWTVPFALVLVAAARAEPLRGALRETRWHWLVLAVALAAAAASPTYRWLLRESLAVRGPLDSLAAQVDGVWYLVTRPLLALRVNFDPVVVVDPVGGVAWAAKALALAAAVALGCAALRRVPWLALGVLWLFVHLAPTNGVVARYDLVNDRQLYLALLGPALIAGVAVARLRVGRMGVAAALVVVLAAATAARNLDYASGLALWQATVRASPGSSRAWNNLGWHAQAAGDREAARAAYARALALDPGNYRARANLDALR